MTEEVNRKLCRALACRKRVRDNQIFCSVHFPMLTPRWVAPIQENREPPALAGREVKRRILSGVQDAVTYLADLEGRAAELATARKVGTVLQGSVGDNPAPSSGDRDGLDSTIKLREY